MSDPINDAIEQTRDTAPIAVVEPRQGLALAHALAFLDQNLRDAGAERGADLGLMDRLDAARGVDGAQRRPLRGHGDGDRGGHGPPDPAPRREQGDQKEQQDAPTHGAAWIARTGSPAGGNALPGCGAAALGLEGAARSRALARRQGPA